MLYFLFLRKATSTSTVTTAASSGQGGEAEYKEQCTQAIAIGTMGSTTAVMGVSSVAYGVFMSKMLGSLSMPSKGSK